jgi:hypothetical protein
MHPGPYKRSSSTRTAPAVGFPPGSPSASASASARSTPHTSREPCEASPHRTTRTLADGADEDSAVAAHECALGNVPVRHDIGLDIARASVERSVRSAPIFARGGPGSTAGCTRVVWLSSLHPSMALLIPPGELGAVRTWLASAYRLFNICQGPIVGVPSVSRKIAPLALRASVSTS